MDMAVCEVLLCLFFISWVVLAMVNYQKNLSYGMGFSAYEYEHTYHLVCFDNSHYSNTYTLSAVWVFAVITPYWEERG